MTSTQGSVYNIQADQEEAYTIVEGKQAENFVQVWKSQIPTPRIDNQDAYDQIKDNVAYILRRSPLYLKPYQFASEEMYLRPDYGHPSFDWDMLDVCDFTIEMQKKWNIHITDEVMYLDFIQLKDVYNYLYIRKDDKPPKKERPRKPGTSAVSQGNGASGRAGAGQKLTTGSLIQFPGQGSQRVGMGKKIADVAGVTELFKKAEGILGYDLLEICLKGPDARLQTTEVAQPALFVSSMAGLLKMQRDTPDIYNGCVVTAGLSLGEYTALCFAGAISFEDALVLVAERGKVMQEAAEAADSAMVSILGAGMSYAKVEELIAEAAKNSGSPLTVSNLLCVGNTVASGGHAACEEVSRLGPSYGATKVIKLKTAGAFHSEYMRPAYERLKLALEKTTIVKPRIPVIFNVDGLPEDDPEKIRAKMLEQMVKPVQWNASMDYCLKNFELTAIAECGAGNVLTGLIRRILKNSELTTKPQLKAFGV